MGCIIPMGGYTDRSARLANVMKVHAPTLIALRGVGCQFSRKKCYVTLEWPHRPLSRRLDRCDRVIHNESGDPNGGNMCSFSGATCTSRVRHNADYVPYTKIRFDL